jgi:hypothetical protein
MYFSMLIVAPWQTVAVGTVELNHINGTVRLFFCGREFYSQADEYGAGDPVDNALGGH